MTAVDVVRLGERQRALGLPEAFEWVHDATPSMGDAARGAGLAVRDCSLLVLDGASAHAPLPPGVPRPGARA